MSTAAVEIRRNGVPAMPHEEFGEVGFTNEDRKMLYKLEALYTEMYKQVLDTRAAQERRIERLEAERAHKDDLDRMEVRITTLLAEKANRTELSGSALKQQSQLLGKQSEDLRTVQARVTWLYAYATGAAAGVIGIFELVKFLLGK